MSNNPAKLQDAVKSTHVPDTASRWQMRFGFGVGDLSFNIVWQGTAIFLMYFYTDVMGISPVDAGLIYMVALIWDAVTDPLVATIADRTLTRWGQYRPYLIAGALPLAASYPLAFSTPGDLNVSPVLWALLTHCLLRTTYTLAGVPFSSLMARVTDDPIERSNNAAWRMFGAALGGLTVAFLTPILVMKLGAGNEAKGYFLTAIYAGLICLASLIFCFTMLKEPTSQPLAKNSSLREDLLSIVPMFRHNHALVRVFLVIIVASICLGMFGKCTLYFFKYNLNRPDLAQWALLLPAFLLLIGAPFWAYVANKTSKKFALSCGSALALCGYIFFYLNTAQNIMMILANIAFIGFTGSALAVMFWAMLPDTVEYGEAKTGIRYEARAFGFASFAQKTAVGINAFLLGYLLESVGFEPNAAQNQQTLDTIKAIMALIPAVGAGLILVILKSYPIDQAYHARLRKIISLRAQKAAY